MARRAHRSPSVKLQMSSKQATALRFAETTGRLYCAFGSIRSGKTFSLPLALLIYTQRLPESRLHLILGRKLRQMELELIPHIANICRWFNLEHHYDRREQLLRVGQQRYYLLAGNDAKSQDRLYGLTCHSLFGDEVTLWPEGFLETAMGRLSFNDSKAWLGCNPSGPKHWLKEHWIDEGRCDQVERFGLSDNPSLGKEVIEGYKRMFTGVFYQRNILGFWAAADGLIWPKWKTETMPSSLWSSAGRCIIGIDVGIANSNSTFVVLREVLNGIEWPERGEATKWNVVHCESILSSKSSSSGDGATMNDLLDKTRSLVDRFRRKGRAQVEISCDSASVGHLFYNELASGRVQGADVYAADKKSLEDGLQLVDTQLATEAITISSDCDELTDEVSSYVWHPDKDRPDKREDSFDYCDALRYAVTRAITERVGRWRVVSGRPQRIRRG